MSNSPRHYRFTFDSEATLRVFVDRVVHYCRDVAILIQGVEAQVIDGHPYEDQREKLYRLAQTTGAHKAQSD